MVQVRITVLFLTGVVVIYIFVETFIGIEPKQPHMEQGSYPFPPAEQFNPVVSGTTIYPGSISHYSLASVGTQS